jgi:outer membrane protein OmpA-like peptidoglycan-associated protein
MLKASLPGYLPEFHELNLEHDSMKGRDQYQYDFFLIPFSIDQILPFRNILFDPSSSVIGPGARPELQRLADVLIENPALSIRLEGHTDNVSKSRSSLNLARRRIKSVKNFLTSKGINASRIEMKAFGGGNPLFRHGTPEAHQANRRVEVRVIAL